MWRRGTTARQRSCSLGECTRMGWTCGRWGASWPSSTQSTSSSSQTIVCNYFFSLSLSLFASHPSRSRSPFSLCRSLHLSTSALAPCECTSCGVGVWLVGFVHPLPPQKKAACLSLFSLSYTCSLSFFLSCPTLNLLFPLPVRFLRGCTPAYAHTHTRARMHTGHHASRQTPPPTHTHTTHTHSLSPFHTRTHHRRITHGSHLPTIGDAERGDNSQDRQPGRMYWLIHVCVCVCVCVWVGQWVGVRLCL